MKKWNIGLIAGSGVIVAGLGSAVLFNGVANGEWDLPGLNQQIQHLTEVTDNHEGRITNLETQANTPTGEPTPTPQVVTKVVTVPAPTAKPQVAGAQAVAAPEPTPAPTIVSYEHRTCDTADAAYQISINHFSDGTETFTNPDGSPFTPNGCAYVAGGNW